MSTIAEAWQLFDRSLPEIATREQREALRAALYCGYYAAIADVVVGTIGTLPIAAWLNARLYEAHQVLGRDPADTPLPPREPEPVQ